MTKAEIKKALECCDSHIPNACGDCPYRWVEECKDKLITSALELITEQEQEINKQNSRVKCLKTRLANKTVLLVNVEEQYEYKTKCFEEEKQILANALKQSEDNYSRAFERLKTQEKKIERLKADYANLQEQFANYQSASDKEINAQVKQAKLDILNELKEKCKFDGHTVAVYKNDIDEMIEEMKK